MARVRLAEGKGIVMHPTEQIALASINRAPYNPRRIKLAKLEALKKSIRIEGFVDPLVVQKKGMVLIGGHQRLRAIEEICREDEQPLPKKVPCIVLDISDRRARILNVALNNDTGEFDEDLLAKMLADLDREKRIEDQEITMLGMSSKDVSELIASTQAPVASDDAGGKAFATSVTLSLQFDSVAARDATKGLLAELTRGGKMSGNVVRALLEERPSRLPPPPAVPKQKKAEAHP